MSLLFRREEQRNISYQDVWGSGGSPLTARTASKALTLIPVYAATALIADQLAVAPLQLFEKGSNGVPRQLPPPSLITNPGFGGIDAYSWKFQAFTSVLLQGNAYGYVLTWKAGVPATVLWLRPEDVTVIEDTDVPAKFYWRGALIPRQDLIHVPGYVTPSSVKGLSPISLFRTQVETGLEAQNFAQKFFRRGTVPSGQLKNTAKRLTSEQATSARDRFVASVSEQKPFVTGADWQYTPLTLPQADIAFLSGIRATAGQIASAYRVPPEDLGGEGNGSSLTYKNLEQDQIKFSVRTLAPWATRFETVINRYLPPNQYVKFNLDASARADLLTRYQAHQTAIGSGFETLDEVRALEDREPLTPEQLEQYIQISAPLKQKIAS